TSWVVEMELIYFDVWIANKSLMKKIIFLVIYHVDVKIFLRAHLMRLQNEGPQLCTISLVSFKKNYFGNSFFICEE
ncbi:hypothetical protein ACJX0J_009008, partial [Zea mays]